MPLAKGTAIGPYEIVGWLGAGGMGDVYRARDPRLDRDVAIKVIRDDRAGDPRRLQRFEQEARAAGQLSHPNIVAVFDVGTHDGIPFIVSELLEGESLRAQLHGGALPPRRAVGYGRQIAEALAAAHERRIIHRDIKPENLFISGDGRLKVLDFGIAKLTRPADEPGAVTGAATETGEGVVLGTAGYMAPEQVRGETVDARADIFSVGAVLYEMLSGRPAFGRASGVETMAAILHEEPPPLPAEVPPALARIAARCLEKAREARFQTARDLAFGLEVLSETATSAAVAPPRPAVPPRRRPLAIAAIATVILGLAATAVWRSRDVAAPPENPLTAARFTPFTDWPGTEALAEISPDGRFVAFLADRDGEFDIWLNQVGTGEFRNLTAQLPPMSPPGAVLRNFGFNGDGAEIWFSRSGRPGDRKLLMPIIGGTPHPFLGEGDVTPSWSPDGMRLVYFDNADGGGDPMFVADRTGADARQILAPDPGKQFGHNHNPVWSFDGEWVYFGRGGAVPSSQMDVWRIRPAGGLPEQLTNQKAVVNFLAPIDARTLLYVARADDRSGPWLWALDTVTRTTRRVSTGLEQYTSVSASRDGRRIVATIARPASSLWSVPILDRPAEDRAVEPYPVTTTQAMAPRLSGEATFYLSARGSEVGLWRFQGGQASEIWKGVDRPLSDPPAVSPDGLRVVLAARQDGKRRLVIMSADGTDVRTLAPSIEIDGAPGAGAADWSPDGAWIVAGGHDAQGQGLFRIPADGAAPIRLVSGHAINPIWSPKGDLIIYAGRFADGQVPLIGVRPDGTPVDLPPLRVREGGYRFLPSGAGLVFLPLLPSLDFQLVDLGTGRQRTLTRLGDFGRLQSFDVTPDGARIVFDRQRENSDIVLIDRPR